VNKALNPMAREFQLPPKPRAVKLNPCASEFKADAPRPTSPKLNIAAAVFKLTGPKPLAVHLNLMEAPSSPSPPPLVADAQKQLHSLVTSKAAAEERIASLLKDIKASGSREAARTAELQEARAKAAEATRELSRIIVSAGLLKLELDMARRAHAEELRAARRADTHEMTVLRDARDELLSQKEQLEHQLHHLRRELAQAKSGTVIATYKSEAPNTLQALLSKAPLPLLSHAQAPEDFFPAPLPTAGVKHNSSGQIRPDLSAHFAAGSEHVLFASVSAVPQPSRAASLFNTAAPIAKRVFQKQMGVAGGRPNGSTHMFARETLKPFRQGQQTLHMPSHQRFG
jgi:cell division septum initiation protein DivIVA